jgi:ABC-type anion transport system duplicated permease subunit
VGAIEDAVRQELADLDAEITAPGLAAAALNLAHHQDETEAATAAAVVARDLRAILLDLRRLAPVKTEGDAVDDIAAQREKRRAALKQPAAGE